MYYNARITEAGKVRYVDAYGITPGDALEYLLANTHIRRGAIIDFGSANWFAGEFKAPITSLVHDVTYSGKYARWLVSGSEQDISTIIYTKAHPC